MRSGSFVSAIGALAILLLFTLPAGAEWNIQTVDSSGDVGKDTAIAYDSQGTPHIAYYDATDKWIKYAKWTGTAWDTRAIENVEYGRTCDIAVDANDMIHVVWWTTDDLVYSDRRFKLRYTRIGGSPGSIIEFISNDSFTFGKVSLAILGTTPHVSYKTPNWLNYTYWNGTAWVRETVDPGPDPATYNSIGVGNDGRVYIAYSEGSDKDLKLAYRNLQGQWSTMIVDHEGEVGTHCSLVLDASQTPHIAYYDATNKKLKHATVTGLN